MNFTAALTTKTELTEVVEDLTQQVRARFASQTADVALLFVHPQYREQAEELLEALRVGVRARHVVGGTATGIIGRENEVEGRPSVSLLVGQLPAVTITPFHITQEELDEAAGPAFWHYELEVPAAPKPNLMLLADPFSVQIVPLVQALGGAYAGAPIIGGLASGGQQPGENRLFCDGEIHESGAVGVALSGRVALRTVVAQGCKPIGEPLTITRAEKNVIFELGGRPPLAVLQELVPQLPPSDQQLARTALFLGRVINEYQEDFGRGDFLIRNLVGHDPQSGALAVGDWMHTGQTVQFQVRDGKCADEDLRQLLAKEHAASQLTPPRGAVLFSCLGRGEGMYGVPNHDLTMLHQIMGPVPTAGCFCNGEIGPVGEQAFVHGFTSVIGLFCEPK